MYNYWKIDINELPSRGFFYNNAEIKCRVLTIADVKFLSSINPFTATTIINEILERCISLKNLDFQDILLCDRHYILFWLRANSFIKNNGYTITIPKCNSCHSPFEKNVKLDDLEEVFIESMPETVIMPDSEISIELKYPTIRDLSIKISNNEDLENIARHIDVENPVDFVNHLSALDYAFLLSKVEEMYAGFKNEIYIDCPKCGFSHKVKIVFNDEGMFGGIKMYDIIKVIINITKYTTMQISDDEPWMELELQEDIVSKMVKEENDQIAKQEAKARSQMHKPSMPHHRH